MADPFSLALGVLGVIQTAASAAEALYDFAETLRNAPEEVKGLSREAHSLYSLLRKFNESFQEPEIKAYIDSSPNVQKDIASLKEPLAHCERSIGELMVKLERNTERSGERTQRVFKALRWYWVKDDVVATRNDLERAKGLVDTAFTGNNYIHALRQSARQQAITKPPGNGTEKLQLSQLTVTELQKKGADLRRAARDGDIVLVKHLLDDGTPVDYKNREGRTALSCAAEYGYADLVRLLLEHKAAVNAKSFEIREGHGYKKAEGKRTALHWAAVGGHIEVASILVNAGASLEATTAHGRSVVLEAALENQLEMVALLLARGANVNAQTYYGWNMLHTAASQGLLELAELAIQRGINVETKYTGSYHRASGGTTNQRALHYAVRTKTRPSPNDTAMVELLVESGGAKLAQQDSKGVTPIHSAVRSKWKSALEILLRRAIVADLAVRDAQGVTALDDAVGIGDSDIVTMINAVQNRGAVAKDATT